MSREAYEKRAEVYWQKYYSQLEGTRIVKYLGDTDGFPHFLVEYPDGEQYTIQVSRDPEGNDGGFLFLPYEPIMDEYDKAHKLNKYKESA
jgi:hypothetical protein